MIMEFTCGGMLEYTGTFRLVSKMEGIKLIHLNAAQKTLTLDGITGKNKQDICGKLQELGWRSTGFFV